MGGSRTTIGHHTAPADVFAAEIGAIKSGRRIKQHIDTQCLLRVTGRLGLASLIVAAVHRRLKHQQAATVANIGCRICRKLCVEWMQIACCVKVSCIECIIVNHCPHSCDLRGVGCWRSKGPVQFSFKISYIDLYCMYMYVYSIDFQSVMYIGEPMPQF